MGESLAHKYDFGPGRECVHWEARRKQRTVDKLEDAGQRVNMNYEDTIEAEKNDQYREANYRPNEMTQEELTQKHKLMNPRISGLERSTGLEGSPWLSKTPHRYNNHKYLMQW